MPAVFDPRLVYTKYTAAADFVLIWALLTILVKWIFVRIKYATKSKKGLGSMFMGALSAEDQKTLFSLEGLMSTILGLMMTLGGMTYYNWSLKALFTGGTFPIVIALIVGAMGYGAAGARTKNGMVKLATALFLGGITFSIAAYGTRSNAGWPSALLWLFLFMLMIVNLTNQVKASGKEVHSVSTGRESVQQASGDIKEVRKKLEQSEVSVAKIKKQADDAEKKQGTLLQDVRNALASVTSTLSNQLKTASATSMMFAAALQVGALMFSNGASAEEVRNELRKRNTSADIIEATVGTLSPQVPPQQLRPTPAAPAPAPVKVVPPAPEATPLPPVVAEKIKKTVTVDLATFESTNGKLLAQISNFEEIAMNIETLPAGMRDVSALGMRVHSDLQVFANSAAVLAEQTKSFPDIAVKTGQLHHDASHALSIIDLENQQFKSSTDPLFSVLASDSGQLQRVAWELKTKLQELGVQLDLLEKNARRLTMGKGKISVVDVQLYDATYRKLEQQLIDINQILAHHGDPVKTVLVALPGTADAVEKARKIFEQLDKDVVLLVGRYSELFEQVQKLQQTKVEEEEKEGVVRVDVQSTIQTLDALLTGIFFSTLHDVQRGSRLQGSGSSQFIPIAKAEVRTLQDNAAEAVKLLNNLAAERKKIVAMQPTSNQDVNDAADLFDAVFKLPLMSDLTNFANNTKLNGMADNPKGDSRLGRTMAQILIGMMGRTNIDDFGLLLNRLKTALGRLPKGAVRASA